MPETTDQLAAKARGFVASAAGCLAQAEHVRNADHWPGDRDGPAIAALLAANANATLAIATELAGIREQLLAHSDWQRERQP